MGIPSGRLNAIHERRATRVLIRIEREPGHGPGARRPRVGAPRRRNGGLLGGDDVELAPGENKRRGAVRVEEVVSQKGQLAEFLAEIQRRGTGEGPGEDSAGAFGGDAAVAGVVEVEGHGVVVERKGGQLVELFEGEGARARVWVEGADVVEHGEGAGGGGGGGADGRARVVLDAEAEGDDFELEV